MPSSSGFKELLRLVGTTVSVSGLKGSIQTGNPSAAKKKPE